MASVLFTWELGSNLGHLGKMRPLMRMAQEQGHQVAAALKNLRYADNVLGDLEFRCFQAPYRPVSDPRPVKESLSYTHTLEDFCFSSAGELYLRIRAWREIFDAVQPDLIYCDFSPGSLIASRGLGVPRVTVGNGFMIPPAENRHGVFAPFTLTPTDESTLSALRDNDRRMLDTLNSACHRAGVPPFDSLGEIFGQADARPLATLPELDHFPWRAEADYIGMQPSFGAALPVWPEGGERRVFCYLQPFSGLRKLLEELLAADLSVLVYMRETPGPLREHFSSAAGIAFIDEPVSIEPLQGQVEFVVHHAGHGVAVQCFTAGIPQLSIPTQQEQLLTALLLDRAGVGETARHFQPGFAGEIRRLLGQGRYRERALAFRDQYRDFSWADSEKRQQETMRRLLA